MICLAPPARQHRKLASETEVKLLYITSRTGPVVTVIECEAVDSATQQQGALGRRYVLLCYKMSLHSVQLAKCKTSYTLK